MKRYALVNRSILHTLSRLAFLSFLLIFTQCSDNPDKKQEKEVVRNPVEVKVMAVKPGILVKTLDYKGTVYPWKRANIGPDISGRVHKIYKKQGDTVKQGQLLAQLDTTALSLQLKQAKAALDVAKAAHKDAARNARRLENLFAKTAISKLQLEKAQLLLENTRTSENSAAATVALIEYNLETSHMRAPFDGIVTSKNIEEGDVINPMMGMGTSVLTLMDLSCVKIMISIPAEEIESITLDQPCSVGVSTLKDQSFKGAVFSKNLAADPLSKTFKVEIKVENPGNSIKAGVFAEVSIEVYRGDHCLVLPLTALNQQGGVDYVVLYQKGKATIKNIKVGERNLHRFEVLEGLIEGELVVIEGNYDLKNNAPIHY